MVFGPRSRPSLWSWNDGMPRTATPFISYSPGPVMSVGVPARAPVLAWSKWPCVTRAISVWNRGGVRPISFANGSMAMTASRVSIRKQDWTYQVMVMGFVLCYCDRGLFWRSVLRRPFGRRSGALSAPLSPMVAYPIVQHFMLGTTSARILLLYSITFIPFINCCTTGHSFDSEEIRIRCGVLQIPPRLL